MKAKKNKIIILERDDIRVIMATKNPPEYLEVQQAGKTIYKAGSKKKIKSTVQIWTDAD